jgi:drug/metabolite transporter (DMT)-like permease
VNVAAVVFALLAATTNALSSVLQRLAARTAPPSDGCWLSQVRYLLRQPVWYGGMAGLILGFLLQASALDRAPLALVQPLLVTELPLTLLFARPLLHMPMEPRSWVAAVLLAAGLALLLVAASPSGGQHQPSSAAWVLATAVTGGILAVLVTLARHASGPLRSALLGACAGIGFGLTAAFMKAATEHLGGGLPALLDTWQVYAMVFSGIASVALLQAAFHAGPIIAAQPPVTLLDPIASTGYGIALFSDQVRGGWWIALELTGLVLIAAGTAEMSRSPLLADASWQR